MFENAREFLSKALPWPQTANDGYINIHTLSPSRNGLGGRAFRDLDDAINFINWQLTNGQPNNIYACMSSQSMATPAQDKLGRTYFRALRNQDHAVKLKSLYLDLDVGPDPKKFATFEEMQGEFLRLLKETGLPRPTYGVRSGNGGHVHWVFDQAVEPDAYRVIAFSLVEACRRHNIKVDGGCTTDTARVLRIPDTWNFKSDPPKPVMVWFPYGKEHTYAELEATLQPYKVAVPVAAAGKSFIEDLSLFPVRTGSMVDNSAAYAGVETAMPAEEIRACLDAIPNTKIDWDFWNTTGMRVYAASDGADYGLAEWERWSATNLTVVNPTDSCRSRWDTYHHSPPTHTGAGALVKAARDAVGDPKWVPRVAQPVTTQVTGFHVGPLSDIPLPYTRDAKGRICVLIPAKKQDEQDQVISISDYHIDNGWLQGDPQKSDITWLNFTTSIRGHDIPVAIRWEDIGGQNMRTELQKQGLMLQTGRTALERIGNFMSAWVTYLQQKTIPVKSSPFGWNVENSIVNGFVYGGRKWSAQGDTPAAIPDPVMFRAFSPTSANTQPWRDAVRVITGQGRPELDVIIASAFAAPLVKCTGYPGVMLSPYSTASGVGKTTAIHIAQAVWGHPIKGKSSLSDTENSLMNKMGQLKNLPIYWDEIKTEDQTKRFVNITFNTTEGKEKSRLNRSGRQIEPGDWYTLLVSASNVSLLDFVVNQTSTTTAGLYRIFEYHIDRAPDGAPGRIIPSDAQRLVAKLNDAYGAVGAEYSRYLGSNYVALEQEVTDESRRINLDMKAIEDERFWVASMSVLLVGARVATRLGFVQFSEQKLREFLYKTMLDLRKTRTEQPIDMSNDLDISSMLQQFVNAAKANHLLITDHINMSAGKPRKNSVKVMNDPTRVQGVWMQIGVNDKMLRISSSALGNWCVSKKLSRRVITKAMEDQFGFQRITAMLGSGTSIPEVTGFAEHIYQIDITNTPFLNIIDGM